MTERDCYKAENAVAIAFDGAICPTPLGGGKLDPPDPKMVDFLKALKKEGIWVICHTKRAKTSEGRAEVVHYLVASGLASLVEEVTAEKPYCLGYIEPEAIDITGAEEMLQEIRRRKNER